MKKYRSELETGLRVILFIKFVIIGALLGLVLDYFFDTKPNWSISGACIGTILAVLILVDD